MKKSRIVAILFILCMMCNIIVPFTKIYAVDNTNIKRPSNDLEKIKSYEISEEEFKSFQCTNIGNDFSPMSLYSFSRNSYASTYGYNTLDSENKKNAYLCMKYAAYEFHTSSKNVQQSSNGLLPAISFDVSQYNLSIDDVLTVYLTFYYDNPEYFWVDGVAYSYTWGSNKVTGVTLTTKPEYVDGQSRISLTETINKNIEKYLDFVSPMSDDFEKELILHDALIYYHDYAYDSNGNPELSSFAHNIVGVFDDDPNTDPVCEGYAKAFSLLMNASGIDCGFIAGDAGGAHAWNQVKLDNEWYNVDVTWDDPGGQKAYYGFFNLSDSIFGKTHTPFYPTNPRYGWCYPTFKCTATKYSVESQKDKVLDISLAKTVTYDSTEQLSVCVFNQGVEVPSGGKVLPNTKLSVSVLSKDNDIDLYYMLDVNGKRMPIEKIADANSNGYIEYGADYVSDGTDLEIKLVEKSDADFDLKLNNNSIAFDSKGNNNKLEVTFKGKVVDISTLKFTSDNPYVAKVNKSGIVTSVGSGTAKIKVSSEELQKETICNVVGNMQFLLGDIDNNGDIEIADAYSLLRFIVARMDESSTPSTMLPAANLSEDDEIDIMDAYSLVRLVVKNM